MSRGHDRERAVRKVLEQDGWWTCRAAGSLGDADVVALRAYEIWTAGRMKTRSEAWLIEVKSTAGGPYERFGPAQRNELRAAAKRAGAEAVLAYWPPRKPLRWIPEEEWPS